jgi:hypothetical protein
VCECVCVCLNAGNGGLVLQELMGIIVDAEAKEAKGERSAYAQANLYTNQTSILTKLLH